MASTYIEVLEDRRRRSDIRWVTREWDCPTYKNKAPRTPQQIKEQILGSDRLQYTIREVSDETDRSVEDVTKEAKSILEEMAHNYSLSMVRVFGIMLVKIMKKLYRGIYVNSDGLEKLRSLIPEHPVILMPTHRSYADFLLLGYVCFNFNLPLPAVAAGQDFMSMKVMGTMMRNAGAFFIRRSFGTDKLYWSVFTEYVQNHLINGDFPVEFFVEGTRSRTGKSLTPKLGFLSTVLEPFFKSFVPDTMIVPVSISYDRTLEDTLYAYELLGVPKPKESTRGLFKARKILAEDFGRIFMKIGEPISVWDYFEHKIQRGLSHNCGPRFLSPLTSEELGVIEELAYDVVLLQQRQMILSPFVIAATVVLGFLHKGISVIPFQVLKEKSLLLKLVLMQLGATISWESSRDPETVLKMHLKVHGNVVELTEEGNVRIKEIHDPKVPVAAGELKGHAIAPQTLSSALGHTFMSHYTNQLLHVTLHESMVTLALRASQDKHVSIEWIFNQYTFLEKLLHYDFIFKKGATTQMFETTMKRLPRICSIQVDDNHVKWSPDDEIMELLCGLLDPFLISYKSLCQSLRTNKRPSQPLTMSEIVRKAQGELETAIGRGDFAIWSWSSLSIDTLTNGVHSLAHLKALRKEKSEDQVVYTINYVELETLIAILDPYLKWSIHDHKNEPFISNLVAKL